MRFDLIFLRVIIARMCKFKVLMDAIYAGGLLINFFFFGQLCDGSVVAVTVLHNVNCNHGLIYVTSQV